MSSDQQSNTIIKELFKRRVPQIMGFYLGASWGIIQFVEWLVNRYTLSPVLPDIAFVILLSLIPTVLILAYFHGQPDKQRWTRVEAIGIPVNLIVTVILLTVLFQGSELGATSTNVTVQTEDGTLIERAIPKSEFRKRVLLFYFENKSGQESLDWFQYAVAQALSYDMLQDIYMNKMTPSEFNNLLKDEGIEDPTRVPLTLKLKMCRRLHFDYMISGTFDGSLDALTINTTLYNAESGRAISEQSFSGNDPFELVDQIAETVKLDLDIPSSHIETIRDLPVAEILTSSTDALRHYVEGYNAQIYENDFTASAARFEQAIAADPEFAFGYLLMAVAYANANEPGKVAEPLDQAMKLIYKMPEPLQFQTKALNYLLKGQNEKRETVLNMWKELYPNDLNALQSLSQLYWDSAQYEKAIAIGRRILEQSPGDYYTLVKIGDGYVALGEMDKALNTFEAYRQQVPEQPLGYTRLASTHARIGNFTEAKSFYEKAQMFEPNDLWIRRQLAVIDMNLGDFVAAESQLQALLAEADKPDDRASVYSALADFYLKRGQAQKAADIAIKRIETMAEYARPLNLSIDKAFGLNTYLINANRIDDAIKNLNTDDLIAPFDKTGGTASVLLYAELKDTTKMKEGLAIASEFAQTTGIGVAQRMIDYGEARLDELRKDYDAAIAHYQEFLEKQPGSTSGRIELARCLRLNGAYQEAIEDLTAVLKRSPFNPDAHYEIALSYEKMGKMELANKHIDTALDIWAEADPDYKEAVEAKEAATRLKAGA